MKDDASDRKQDNPWSSINAPYHGKAQHDAKLLGVFLFGLIGATVTTLAVSSSRFISRISFQIVLLTRTKLATMLLGGLVMVLSFILIELSFLLSWIFNF